jgi:cytochrome c oxidase subunit 2
MNHSINTLRQNKAIVIIPLLLLLAAGCGAKPDTSITEQPTTETATSSGTTNTQTTPPDTNQSTVKTFTVIGKNFSFSPSEIKVNKGDKVKIIFQNDLGFHDWMLDEFNVKTPTISAGKTAEVEFTADKTGTFEYYCSVGNHRTMGMKGNLIVQ